MPLHNPFFFEDVQIANGASVTSTIRLDTIAANSGDRIPSGTTLSGIFMPAAWTAANLTFRASYDGTNFFDMYDDLGAEFSVTASTSRFIMLDPAAFAGVNFLVIRSGTASTPVNQGALRTLTLALRQYL